MRKTVRCLAATVALVLALPVSGFAQAKIKIAIWEFENHAESSWWFFKDMGPAARNQIDTEFSENKLLSSKFSVVERDKLALVLKEQGLATSGAVDPASAAKVGKILGVKYILLGGIDKFNIDKTGGQIGKFAGERSAGETFGEWLERSGGAAAVGTAVKDLDQFPTPEEAPEFYVDFDETGPYEKDVGDSECAT